MKSEQATSLFSQGHNCAQSVLMVFAEQYGLDIIMAQRLNAGFGGGFGRTGEVCGAVSGAIQVISLANSDISEDMSVVKEKTFEMVNEFLDAFKEKNGSVLCKDLIDGIILKEAEGRKEWADRGLHGKICTPAVASAAEILDTLLPNNTH